MPEYILPSPLKVRPAINIYSELIFTYSRFSLFNFSAQKGDYFLEADSAIPQVEVIQKIATLSEIEFFNKVKLDDVLDMELEKMYISRSVKFKWPFITAREIYLSRSPYHSFLFFSGENSKDTQEMTRLLARILSRHQVYSYTKKPRKLHA